MELKDYEILLKLLGSFDLEGLNLAHIYDALDLIAQAYQVNDIVALFEDRSHKTHFFRLNHLVPDTEVVFKLLQEKKIGLYALTESDYRALGEPIYKMLSLMLDCIHNRHDASHDPLTQLANRRTFDEYLKQFASQASRYDWMFSLVLLDIDNFKELNDTHGHAYGDEVLKQLSGELKSILRAGDIACRIGGDEFAVILANASKEGATQVVKRIRENLLGLNNKIEISVGLSCAPTDGCEPEILFALADSRLYENKTQKVGK